MKVLCIGEILIDFTPRLDIANSYVANPGGAPANVAVSVQRCGGQAGFLGKTGADLLLSTEDVNAIDIADWDIVHAGSVSQSGTPEREAVLLALQKAKEHGKIVSFDVNYRETIWSKEECKEQVDRVLPYVDLLKISEDEYSGSR